MILEYHLIRMLKLTVFIANINFRGRKGKRRRRKGERARERVKERENERKRELPLADSLPSCPQ